MSVYPSRGAFATTSAPIAPVAPGRLSTTTGCPSCSVSFGPTMRATISGVPPGAAPTTMRSGFVGKPGTDPACENRGLSRFSAFAPEKPGLSRFSGVAPGNWGLSRFSAALDLPAPNISRMSASSAAGQIAISGLSFGFEADRLDELRVLGELRAHKSAELSRGVRLGLEALFRKRIPHFRRAHDFRERGVHPHDDIFRHGGRS